MTEAASPLLSVVAPAHDEEGNVEALVDELRATLAGLDVSWELLVVDDNSGDGTRAALAACRARCPQLRVLVLEAEPRGAPLGQSAALGAGLAAARGAVVATIDADGQNDPADIPRLLDVLGRGEADLVQGDRTRRRADGLVKRASSAVARLTRRVLLGDTVRDTGCTLRVMRREVAAGLPLDLDGMHRFIPHLARAAGHRVVEMPVAHRPRTAGRSKYGIRNRALRGLADCLAVRWMTRRRRPAVAREDVASGDPPCSASSPCPPSPTLSRRG
ncbi:MAG: glycosyltransferase family 2 protein [Planctomycetota bacterium]|jgi:glycosyltransferase involved in cell wall biosynthesis